MNFHIIKFGALTRRDVIRSVIKWVLYSLLLLIAFVWQCTFPFFGWQPLLTLTLSCAVSFFEGELSGSVFALFAGMLHDLSTGGLFGFTCIWLVPCSLFVTLLAVNLIRQNIINYLWMNLATLVIVEFMELLFKHIIWRNPHTDIILLNFMLPAVISSVVLSAPVFLLVRFLNRKLGLESDEKKISSVFANVSNKDSEY